MPESVGRYRLIREIGRGATATVYLAQDPERAEPVAVKHVSFRERGKDGARINRRLLKLLRAEEAVSQRMNHPNIIKIYEVIVRDVDAYIVMEYFQSETLEKYCSFEMLMPVNRVVSVIFKCCMALDYAYRQGIVHRDIKPANILIDAHDNVKITDFGLALNLGKKSDQDSTFIMGVGSPAYMSPEQIKSYPLNQKTDIYSLGVVLFHLLTGRLPFRAKNSAQLVYKIINTDTPSACLLNPAVPEKMDAVIKRSMEKDLYSRYKNGAEFAKDLSSVRFKIMDEEIDPIPDSSRFGQIRRLAFFLEFDDIEIWEVVRFSSWRTVEPLTQVIREGSSDQRFGILLEGQLEVSIGGKVIDRLVPGDSFGVAAYLNKEDHTQQASVVSLSEAKYLEILPSALMLASDECIEHFRARMVTSAVQRLLQVERALAVNGVPATRAAIETSTGLELQLVDD